MYRHQILGLSNVTSIKQYDYDSHIEAWLLSRIKVVGPNYDARYWGAADLSYQASIGDYDLDCKVGYGYTPDEAKAELMAQLGY